MKDVVKFDPPDIPKIARGEVIPENIRLRELEKSRELEEIEKQRRHDFLVATYGIIGGIVSGVASSLIVLWLQGLL